MSAAKHSQLASCPSTEHRDSMSPPKTLKESKPARQVHIMATPAMADKITEEEQAAQKPSSFKEVERKMETMTAVEFKALTFKLFGTEDLNRGSFQPDWSVLNGDIDESDSDDETPSQQSQQEVEQPQSESNKGGIQAASEKA